MDKQVDYLNRVRHKFSQVQELTKASESLKYGLKYESELY